jgi:hypothetical protein
MKIKKLFSQELCIEKIFIKFSLKYFNLKKHNFINHDKFYFIEFQLLIFFLLNYIQHKNIFIYFCKTKINIMKTNLLRSISKKTLIVGLGSIVTLSIHAQNIGINATGTPPNSSAGLDVDFTNKGVLIPRVGLTSASDAVTIPSPATSLLVYNTGTGGLSPAGYYYNAGTPGSPNWVQLLTSGSALSGSGVATRVAFWTGATSLGSNANLYWDNTNSRLGVGTAAPAQPLHVIGTGRFSAIASGPNSAIVTSNSSGDLGALNFTGSNTQFLLGNATWGTIGAGGVAPICGSPSANYVQKWTGTNLCNSIIFDNGTNVGIGTTAPAQKLDVVGNVQFSGALMPAGNAGSTGQVLRSQGPGIAPVWFPMAASIIYQNAFNSTGSVCINGGWTTHPGCSVTIALQAGDVVWAWGYGAAMADNNCDGTSDAVYCYYNVRIAVNGADFPDGAWARSSVDWSGANYSLFNAYCIAGRFTAPTSGNYTFELQTSWAGGSGNAITAGNNTSALQSGMMIIVYRP